MASDKKLSTVVPTVVNSCIILPPADYSLTLHPPMTACHSLHKIHGQRRVQHWRVQHTLPTQRATVIDLVPENPDMGPMRSLRPFCRQEKMRSRSYPSWARRSSWRKTALASQDKSGHVLLAVTFSSIHSPRTLACAYWALPYCIPSMRPILSRG